MLPLPIAEIPGEYIERVDPGNFYIFGSPTINKLGIIYMVRNFTIQLSILSTLSSTSVPDMFWNDTVLGTGCSVTDHKVDFLYHLARPSRDDALLWLFEGAEGGKVLV